MRPLEKWPQGSRKIGQLVGEIAAASQEQAQGIEQVSKAISEMDQVVQNNAASAEESASAAEEMNAQAEQMKSIVRELQAIIGGENGQQALARETWQGSSGPGTGALRKILQRPAKALPVSVRPDSTTTKGRLIEPKQMIPLDDEDFSRF